MNLENQNKWRPNIDLDKTDIDILCKKSLQGTNHKGTLCFFSTESQCDFQGVIGLNSQRYGGRVEQYQQVVLLVSPMAHHFQ